jgi:excinuclease ABC subunit A
LSGSGKSSLAFDTLYAEGQRRYVESLSSYARQFLGRMSKPECDYIKGIPPAIAIQQKVNTRNPRSTVGTSTEIYDYLRLLFARIGKTISPVTGEMVKKHSAEDVVEKMLTYEAGTRLAIFCEIHLPEEREMAAHLDVLMKQGFTRIEIEGNFYRIEEVLKDKKLLHHEDMLLLIDRLAAGNDNDTISRLTDSVETAFFEGRGSCLVKFYGETEEAIRFSKRFEADGIVFQEPNDLMFSFNSPAGACPRCEGFGRVMGIDEDLVIPNKALSVYEDAVVCWKGEKMSEWKVDLIRNAQRVNFPIHRPYYQLTEEEKELLWRGTFHFGGIDQFFQMLEDNQYKIQYRVMLARYRGKTVCPDCKGSRLKKEALYVKIAGKVISDLVLLPIGELKEFFNTLELDDHDKVVAKRLLTEINNRIQFLLDVGLGYLTLNRLSASLSGGESQRINLSTSLGSGLVGSLYILDEPSIGLHSRDTDLLINVLRKLQGMGNTVVVVEHDEEIIRAADYIIDIGPNAGRLGGEVVYQGDATNLQLSSASHTVRYLTGEEVIETPAFRRKWSNYIELKGVAQNNLKGIDVKFPLNALTLITGVSGSGKSSLIRDVFYQAVRKHFEANSEKTGIFGGISGDLHLVNGIEFVDQNPIGKSSRSNPATYLKAYDEIRKLYSDQPLSKQLGFTPAHFSFNVEGGRCEECKGEGTITVEMQFMADLVLECDACHGKRFKQDTLEVEFHGKNIFDILELTVLEAVEFFTKHSGSTEKKIVKRLQPLLDVGLGYIKLGQSSSTLSGGENQRVKLALFLSGEKTDPTIFVFDEPTTGLHFHDIKTLLKAFNALIEKGHTVMIIEHNLDVIKCADYIVDLGPEGGNKGGHLVCCGTPEEVAKCESSFTGQFLKEKLA